MVLGCSDGSGTKIFDLGWVGSVFCGSGQVGSAIYGLGLNFENFPKIIKFFNFSFRVRKNLFRLAQKAPRSKAGLASYLLRVKSKSGLGWIWAHLYMAENSSKDRTVCSSILGTDLWPRVGKKNHQKALNPNLKKAGNEPNKKMYDKS